MRKSTFGAFLGAVALGGSGLAIASGGGAPAVTAGAASAITNTSATVTGSVNPNGQATTYAFQYGTSTQYSEQTALQDAGSGAVPVAVTANIADLQPGTTYHFRIIASNASGTSAGSDATFKTGGLAPSPSPSLAATTGTTTGMDAHGAELTGTINPSGSPVGETVRYYFQLGTTQPYALQTIVQTFPAGNATVPVHALATGLASGQLYHYRLLAVNDSGGISAGADQTFSTLPTTRLRPLAVNVSVSPTFQRRLPDTVTVSGRLVPPPSLTSAQACQGYFDIAFRVGNIVIQMLRAGIHNDCTFSLPVVFHNRQRLLGGHVRVEVLFADNQFLQRLEAPAKAIQIG
jgi:hypothetical protein